VRGVHAVDVGGDADRHVELEGVQGRGPEGQIHGVQAAVDDVDEAQRVACGFVVGAFAEPAVEV